MITINEVDGMYHVSFNGMTSKKVSRLDAITIAVDLCYHAGIKTFCDEDHLVCPVCLDSLDINEKHLDGTSVCNF